MPHPCSSKLERAVQSLPAPTRHEKTYQQVVGQLGGMKVVQYPDKVRFFDRPLYKKGDGIGQLRDAFGAIIGGEPGGPARAVATDTFLDMLKQAGGHAAWPGVLTHFHNRIITSRVCRALHDLSAEHRFHGDLTKFDAALPFFGGIHGGWSAVVILKRAYDACHEICADIDNYSERQELQRLLEELDLPTGKFYRAADGALVDDPSKMARILELAGKNKGWRTADGGNRMRSDSQRALDVGGKIKDVLALAPSTAIPNLMAISTHVGTTVFGASVGINALGHTLACANNLSKGGVQATAITNIEAARVNSKEKLRQYKLAPGTVRDAPTQQLLVAAGNRMIQERVYTSRLLFLQGISYGLSAGGLWAGLFSGGLGYIAVSLCSTISVILTGSINAGFNMIHGRRLSKRRALANAVYASHKEVVNKMTPEQKRVYFERNMGTPEKIGLIENFLIDTLKGDDKEAQSGVVEFFKVCGISDNTIKAMVLTQDRIKAKALMCKHMYTERTKHSWQNFKKHGHRTVGYLTGITYMRRARKNAARTTQDLVLDPNTMRASRQMSRPAFDARILPPNSPRRTSQTPNYWIAPKVWA